MASRYHSFSVLATVTSPPSWMFSVPRELAPALDPPIYKIPLLVQVEPTPVTVTVPFALLVFPMTPVPLTTSPPPWTVIVPVP